jgi:hypothetical protein
MGTSWREEDEKCIGGENAQNISYVHMKIEY